MKKNEEIVFCLFVLEMEYLCAILYIMQGVYNTHHVDANHQW